MDCTSVVECGETYHLVRIHKQSSCDPAMMMVSEPWKPPSVTLVSLTHHSYSEAGPMTLSSLSSPSSQCDVVHLHEGDDEFTLQLTPNTSIEINNGVTAFVRNQQGAFTVVLSLLPLNSTVILAENMCSGVGPLVCRRWKRTSHLGLKQQQRFA